MLSSCYKESLNISENIQGLALHRQCSRTPRFKPWNGTIFLSFSYFELSSSPSGTLQIPRKDSLFHIFISMNIQLVYIRLNQRKHLKAHFFLNNTNHKHITNNTKQPFNCSFVVFMFLISIIWQNLLTGWCFKLCPCLFCSLKLILLWNTCWFLGVEPSLLLICAGLKYNEPCALRLEKQKIGNHTYPHLVPRVLWFYLVI